MPHAWLGASLTDKIFSDPYQSKIKTPDFHAQIVKGLKTMHCERRLMNFSNTCPVPVHHFMTMNEIKGG